MGRKSSYPQKLKTPPSHPWKKGGQAHSQAMYIGATGEAAGQNDGKGRTPEPQRGWKALCWMPRAITRAEEIMGTAVRCQAF